MSIDLRGEGSFDVAATAEIDPSVEFGASCERIRIGHGSRIARDVYVDVKDLTIGDYVTIHHGTVIHGESIRVGHNCWIGQYCILDGHGGLLSIGNNVGVGAHSQLWSHMKFGDTLAGCRWHRMDSLVIEDDVWFVGHCIVTPIVAHERSMLMVGGVATSDMKANHVYAGSPAKDMTDVFGPQFEDRSDEEMLSGFVDLIDEFRREGGNASFVRVREGDWPSERPEAVTIFSPRTREYLPRYSSDETALLKFLLYDRAKFVPISL